MDEDKFAAPYLLIRWNFDISDDEIGALWKYVRTDDSDHADAFRAPVPLSTCELVQLHTVGSSAMLPTKKRRDERELLPRQRGGEEHLPNDPMWSPGAKAGEQLVRWPATWLHIVALQEGRVHLPSGADPAATFGHRWTP